MQIPTTYLSLVAIWHCRGIAFLCARHGVFLPLAHAYTSPPLLLCLHLPCASPLCTTSSPSLRSSIYTAATRIPATAPSLPHTRTLLLPLYSRQRFRVYSRIGCSGGANARFNVSGENDGWRGWIWLIHFWMDNALRAGSGPALPPMAAYHTICTCSIDFRYSARLPFLEGMRCVRTPEVRTCHLAHL